MSRLGQAIALAAEAHKDQYDKGGEPYILHPLHVMHNCRDLGESGMIVAVLHDVIEDSDVKSNDITFLTLRERLALENLTRRKGEAYKDFIERCGIDPLPRKIKIQDILHNMNGSRMPLQREITEKDLARWEKYRIALIRLYRLDGKNV